jgi:hypothetical protein
MDELFDSLLTEVTYAPRAKRVVESTSVAEKRCNCCGITKPSSEFYVRRDRKQGDAYGRLSTCKSCGRLKTRAWYNSLSLEKKAAFNERGRKASYLSRHAGRITEFEAAALAKSKQGICEICRRSTDVFIDHNHRTEARRGFLCASCNYMLGNASDDIELLLSATAYLKKYSE